jgi:hypothetical protein
MQIIDPNISTLNTHNVERIYSGTCPLVSLEVGMVALSHIHGHPQSHFSKPVPGLVDICLQGFDTVERVINHLLQYAGGLPNLTQIQPSGYGYRAECMTAHTHSI